MIRQIGRVIPSISIQVLVPRLEPKGILICPFPCRRVIIISCPMEMQTCLGIVIRFLPAILAPCRRIGLHDNHLVYSRELLFLSDFTVRKIPFKFIYIFFGNICCFRKS